MEGVAWPRGLTRITFGDGFSQSLSLVRWPPGLEEVNFGRCYCMHVVVVVVVGIVLAVVDIRSDRCSTCMYAPYVRNGSGTDSSCQLLKSRRNMRCLFIFPKLSHIRASQSNEI